MVSGKINNHVDDGFLVSVRFRPSCVEGMQLLGALRF
jgi:hypothetical protein